MTDSIKTLKAWLNAVGASGLFFYSLWQMSLPNTLSTQLIEHFALSPLQLGNLSSAFFYANALALFPAGWLLDCGSKKQWLLGMACLSTLGSVLLVFSSSYTAMFIARLLAGTASAFSLIGCLSVVADWFKPQKRGKVTGIIVTLGLSGALLAQTPVALLLEHFSFQNVLITNACVGIFICLTTVFCVADKKVRAHHLVEISVLVQEYRRLFLRGQNWLLGVYASLINLPVTLVGALWGNLYLKETYGLSDATAASVVSMIFIGIMIGSPVFGWLSDHLQSRKMPMLGGAVCILAIALLIFLPNLSFIPLMILFFCLGFFSGAQVISYPAVMESNHVVLPATANSMVCISINVLTAILQPLFGWIVGVTFAQNYFANTYQMAMFLVPLTCFISVLLVFFQKETFERES